VVYIRRLTREWHGFPKPVRVMGAGTKGYGCGYRSSNPQNPHVPVGTMCSQEWNAGDLHGFDILIILSKHLFRGSVQQNRCCVFSIIIHTVLNHVQCCRALKKLKYLHSLCSLYSEMNFTTSISDANSAALLPALLSTSTSPPTLTLVP
jgi:hypothetical protein